MGRAGAGWLAYRDGWPGTGTADDIAEGLVSSHHLPREASDPISTVHFPFIRNHFSYADVLNDRLLCPLFGAMKEC